MSMLAEEEAPGGCEVWFDEAGLLCKDEDNVSKGGEADTSTSS